MTTAQSTIKHRIQVSTNPTFLTIGQIRERYNCSDMWVWRHIKRHSFPAPLRFGGPTSARHWRLADIEAWERSRATSEGEPPRVPAHS